MLDDAGEVLQNAANNNASLINYAAESYFENVNAKLLDRAINESHRLHPYKVALIKNLSYGHTAKKYNLRVERFKTESDTDKTDVDETCQNYLDKTKLVNGSPVVHFNFMPMIDIASGNNWLCMGHKLLLEFQPGKDDLVLLRKKTTDGKYKIKIVDFELQIKKLYPTPAFKARLEKSLMTKPAVYSFTRNVLRTFAVHSGVKHVEWNNIFTGQLPTNLHFILLDNNQVSGSIDVNPHTWLDYGCNRAHLIVNGESNYSRFTLYYTFLYIKIIICFSVKVFNLNFRIYTSSQLYQI